MFGYTDPMPSLILAQESSSPVMRVLLVLAVLFVVLVLPFLIGNFFARRVRMSDYGWKIGLILATIFCGVAILAQSWDTEEGRFDFPLGVDLKGGVILIYQIGEIAEEDEQDSGQPKMGDLVQALTNRINPSGTQEIVIRPYGQRQVEIIIPEVDPIEVERIKRLITTAGSLEFRIVANERDHEDVIALARNQANDPILKRADRVVAQVEEDGRLVEDEVGRWVRVARDEEATGDIKPFKIQNVAGDVIRDARTADLIDVPRTMSFEQETSFERWLLTQGITDIDVLMATNDGFDVTGQNLGSVSPGVDQFLNPCVNFSMKGVGITLFRGLTSRNLPDPDTDFHRRLGIVLDDRLLSAPQILSTISDRGQITGQFTEQEIDFLVGILRSGRLPATLQKIPISENQIGSMLGDDTIRKGTYSIAASLMAVLVFILIYYRFAGLVACLALLTNLILILALMLMLDAPLTLPGLAGLVLTVGMSVDANVLIFERIREERDRGAALRMAIRNGFGRAMSTIVDANVTTLLTAFVLYAIGTDQIRGFAVTLIFGILMSMYTAIFCSRVTFDIAERARWLKSLSMMRLLGNTEIDFIGKRLIAIAGSVILIVVGVVAVIARGQDIFDIDFLGGTSVTMTLKEPMKPDEVRRRLSEEFSDRNVYELQQRDDSWVVRFNNKAAETFTGENAALVKAEADEFFAALQRSVDFSVNSVSVEGREEDTVFKIDSSIPSVELLEMHLQKAFRNPNGGSLLASYSVNLEAVREAQTPVQAPVRRDDNAGTTPIVPAGPSPGNAPPTNDDQKQTPPAEDDAGSSSDPAGNQGSSTSPANDTNTPPEGASEDTKADPTPPSGDDQSRGFVPAVDWYFVSQESAANTNQESGSQPPADNPPTTDPANNPTQPATAENQEPPAGDAAASEQQPPTGQPAAGGLDVEQPETAKMRTEAVMNFGFAINAPTLKENILLAAEALNIPVNEADVLLEIFDNLPDWTPESGVPLKRWKVNIGLPQSEVRAILTYVKNDLEGTPVWSSSSKIGGKVAGDTQRQAIWALLLSLVGIIIYIWIRFQRVVYGLAAVIALVHDVLITLGAIAISFYLAPFLGFLQIEEFKISLPIVAAFLTIIGYSLNDTIVIFDRIREVRGKSPSLTKDMVNVSINQTLSRTLLTSMTTLIVVVILYFFGGAGIHGFAFALVVGVIAGTYSTVFIASPFLLWMASAQDNKRRAVAKAPASKSAAL